MNSANLERAASSGHGGGCPLSRRLFMQTIGLGAAALGFEPSANSQEKPIQGFEKAPEDPMASKGWQPVSDRKLRVGIAGYGVCKFGAEFGFQHHPNVEVAMIPKSGWKFVAQRNDL